MFIADDHVRSWHGLERNFRIKLNPLSEILLIVWNLEHQELKQNHIAQKILVKFSFASKKAYLRNTLCSRLDIKFHLKVMSDICDGFWMIFFYSGDFDILFKKKTLQIAFPIVHHLFCTRFSLQPTYNIIRWVYSWNIYIYLYNITFQ